MSLTAAEDFWKHEEQDYAKRLQQLVRIPSVSAQPEHKEDVKKCAQALQQQLKELVGVDSSLITPGKDGNPIVFGELKTPGAKHTVLIYNHYDVQPADKVKDGWSFEPFSGDIREGKVFGRGATDDKGPLLAVLKAVQFLRQTALLKVNIKFCYEGEEEIGSKNFSSFVKAHKRGLAADSVLISDGLFYGETPSIEAALRGLVYAYLRLDAAKTDLHSGVHGSVVMNPHQALSWLIGQLQDPRSGKVLIPGFYDDVPPVTEKDKAMLKALKFDANAYIEESGILLPRSKDPIDILMRRWFLPTFEEHGTIGGYSGPGQKTIIPAFCERKVSMRIAPGQSSAKAAKAFEAYVKKLMPEVKVELTAHDGYKTDTEGPLFEAAKAAAEFGFNKKPVTVRTGGSIGAVTDFAEHLNRLPIILLNGSLITDGYHAPNEHYRLSQAKGAVKTFANYLNAIAKL